MKPFDEMIHDQVRRFLQFAGTQGILEIVVDQKLWDALRLYFLGRSIFKWRIENGDYLVFMELHLIGGSTVRILRERRVEDADAGSTDQTSDSSQA